MVREFYHSLSHEMTRMSVKIDAAIAASVAGVGAFMDDWKSDVLFYGAVGIVVLRFFAAGLDAYRSWKHRNTPKS